MLKKTHKTTNLKPGLKEISDPFSPQYPTCRHLAKSVLSIAISLPHQQYPFLSSTFHLSHENVLLLCNAMYHIFSIMLVAA